MIVISGSDGQQIDMLQLAPFERDILQQKDQSPVVYRYSSADALRFELQTRSRIVDAARALNASGVHFATFDESRCNERFWTRTANGGFRLRYGVLPSDGIYDIFRNGDLYAFECAAAIVIVLYKAVLDMIGPGPFNAYFADLLLYNWNYDRDLHLTTTYNINEAYPGDILYFKNPDYDPKTPEWRGENTVLLGYNMYYGHGIGIRTSMDIIASLNAKRRFGSMTSAYLTDQVVHPDFEHLRRLPGRIIARVGNKRFVC
ncbi:protein-glutamine gamma-glutamyltransferase [Paenibacillus beijingensis]|uniref:Protein-glutamine gamma-glutamyltransferase n=1 Tax=Paenibacillus beijingensis TaxID=1126833 RepID=A0A0D5NJL4_9BACL|nr:protein-glutamine gamma-glutamyltransferase [Paenibacillus beijingensis]AJY75172.1 protein-glutamine gamma-glutamyltransferase [Paenibacillus beijingensis]